MLTPCFVHELLPAAAGCAGTGSNGWSMTDSNVTAAALTRIIANLVSEDGDGDDDDNDGDYYTVNILLRHKDHAQNIKTHGNSNNSNRYNNVTETRKSIIALRIKRLL